MGKLVLSKNTTVELNGKKVTLKEGTAVKIDRNTSLFKIDNEFQVDTEKGKMLIEPGDHIKIGGDHKALTPSEFISSGKKFVLEKGDSFGVVEEGFFGEIKRGFLGQDSEAQVLGSMIDKLSYLTKKIKFKTGKWFEKQGFPNWKQKKPNIKSPYDNLWASEEMRTLKDITALKDAGEDVNEILDGLDNEDFKIISDPTETIKRIRDELVRIGDKRLAQVAEDMVSTNIFSKASRVMNNLLGNKMAKNSLTKTKEKRIPEKEQARQIKANKKQMLQNKKSLNKKKKKQKLAPGSTKPSPKPLKDVGQPEKEKVSA